MNACRAEWIKARTLAATGWLLAGTIVLGIGLSAAVCSVVRYDTGGGLDPVRFALSDVQLAQAVIAIFAVRTVSGEYRSGMIRTTLTAVPRRGTVLAAKTTVIATLSLATGTITVTGSLLIARTMVATNGFPLRAAFGSILDLGLISLLATGIALAVRDSAAAIGVVLGLLYLFPLAAQLIGNPVWQRLLQRIGPTTAGLGVLTTWAVASIIAGGLVLHLRDS